MSDPIVKDGRLECPEILNWTRRQRCRVIEMAMEEERSWMGIGVVGCRGPVDPHHVEGKGMGGARCRDDRVVPLCRKHHDQAHGLPSEEIVPNVGFSFLGILAIENLSRFLEDAGAGEVRAYVEALERWKQRPLAVPR